MPVKMSTEDELVDEIWVSGTYTTVFFSRKNVREFLDSLLNDDGSPPEKLNTSFVPRKLKKPYTKHQILNASVDQLKEMLGIKD